MLRRHRMDVYRLVRRFVADAEEAVDLTQEVFLRAFTHRKGFRSESAFSTWLYRIAINLCQDEERKNARRKAREMLTADALELSESAPSPLDTLLARERGERLHHLAETLPPEEYTAVMLHYYTGLTQKQVAEVLGVGLSTVEQRLHRSLARLRAALRRGDKATMPPSGRGEQHLTVGRILLQLRDYEAALPYCEKAVTLMPESVDALCALATAYWRASNYEGCWEMAQRALRIDPDWGEAHNLCGIVYGMTARGHEAIAAFERAAADTRWNAREKAYNNLGTTYVFMGRWQDALAPLEQAIALNPRYAVAHTHLGNVYLEQRRYDDALRCQDRATALDPRFFQAHFNRGEVLEKIGNVDEAIASYRRASELAPWWIDAHAAWGLLLHQQGRHDEAEAQFTTALSIQGGGGYGTYFKGRIHLAQGDIAQAIAYFQQAAQESPESAEPLLALSRVHAQQGDLTAAVRVLREAAKREPENEEARVMLKAYENRPRRRTRRRARTDEMNEKKERERT